MRPTNRDVLVSPLSRCFYTTKTRCRHESFRVAALRLTSEPHRFLSNPGIKFVLDAVRLTPVPEGIDRAQLTHELLA